MHKTREVHVLALIGAVVISILIGMAFGKLLPVVETLGRYIPQDDLSGAYVIGATWAVVIGVSMVILPIPAHHKVVLFWAWVIRSVIALGLMLLEAYASPDMDAFKYYYWSKTDWLDLSGFAVGDGTYNIARLVGIHHLIFPDSFYMIMVTWALVGLIAAYLFYRAATLLIGADDRPLLYISTFAPSVLYWSSLMGKEPISFLGMGLYAYGAISWFKRGTFSAILVCFTGIVIVTGIRTWYGPLLILPLIFIVFGRNPGDHSRGTASKVAFMLLLVLGLVFAWNKFRVQHQPNFNRGFPRNN